MTRALLCALVVLFLAPLAAAQSPRQLNDESAALVEQLVHDRAAAIAAIEGRIGEREASMLSLMEADRRRTQAALTAAQAARADEGVYRAQIVQINADMNALIDDVARRDARFGAEIAEYRRQVSALAVSEDPRRRDALARYARGDRGDALSALVALQEAETISVAAGWSEIGALADDMKDRGEMAPREVVRIYETVVRLDPSNAGAWLAISNLARDLGEIDAATDAAQRSVQASEGSFARAAALEALAAAQRQQGDEFQSAQTLTEAGGALSGDAFFSRPSPDHDQLLLRAHRVAAAAEVDVDPLRLSGMRNLMTVVAISRRMGAAQESELAHALLDLADVQVDLGFAAAARINVSEGLDIARRRSVAQTRSLLRRRELIGALTTASRAASANGDRAQQLVHLREALELARGLRAETRDSLSTLNLLAWLLDRVGHLHLLAGASEAGISALVEAVAVRRAAAGNDTGRGLARRRLAMALASEARLPGHEGKWTEAAEIFAQDAAINPTSVESEIAYEAANAVAVLAQVDAIVQVARASPQDLAVQIDSEQRLQGMVGQARRTSGTKIVQLAAIECVRRILALAPEGSSERDDALESLRFWLVTYGDMEWVENAEYWDAAAMRAALDEAVALRRSPVDTQELVRRQAADDRRLGRLTEARQHIDQSIAELRRLGAAGTDTSYSLAESLSELARIAMAGGDANTAAVAAAEFNALERARLAQHPARGALERGGLADGLALEASALRQSGRWADAVSRSTEEVEIRRQTAETSNIGGPTDSAAFDAGAALRALGDAERGRRRNAEAARAYEACLTLAREHEFKWLIVEALERLGTLPGGEARLEEARTLAISELGWEGRGPRALLERLFSVEQVAALAEPEFGAQGYYSQLGQAALEQGDVITARQHFEAEVVAGRQHVSAYPTLGFSYAVLGAALGDMARLDRRTNHVTSATQRTQESEEAYRRALSRDSSTNMFIAAARNLERLRETNSAR